MLITRGKIATKRGRGGLIISQRQYHFAPALVVLVVSVLGGVYFVVRLFAANALSLETERYGGTLIRNDATASGGSYIQFGSTVPPLVLPTSNPQFTLAAELYGDAAAIAQQYLSLGLANGFSFHTSLTSSENTFITANHPPFLYFNIPVPAIGSCYPASSDPNAANVVRSLYSQLGGNVWMLAMPEFDQGGGCWPNAGRPAPVGTGRQTYDSWVNFYKNTLGLGSLLAQSVSQRGYQVAATCVYAFCPQYAYDMGADMVLLERVIDEVSGMTPGLAMIRGAAMQHGGKLWGVEFSTWRYWTNSPTEYDSLGRMTGGWSPSWFKRHLWMAFMAGSNMNFGEGADYFTGGQGGLNPLGAVVQQFGNYAQQRHPDRGTPYVPMAILQDHYSGFEPKFGQYIQADYSWYSQLGYTEGDKLLSNLFSLAYPGYNSHGTLVPGGPQSVAEYRSRLASGQDPRPWEPMGNSRWGETFDVITNQAALTTLQRYRAIVLTQSTVIVEPFRTALIQYVQKGGSVVLTPRQLGAADLGIAGVSLAGTSSSASSIWSASGAGTAENNYSYSRATLAGAAVIARTGSGDPLVTVNNYGQGQVYLITADLMQNTSRVGVLGVVQSLLDQLQSQYEVAHVSGPLCEYLVNVSGNKIIVTVVNTTGAAWSGQISYVATNGSVREYITDTGLSSSMSGGRVVASATVPPWDVRVFTLER